MFPTPVGMNRRLFIRHAPAGGVPHTRGDEPAYPAFYGDQRECSPHPWG